MVDGDQSHGWHILGMGAVGSQRSVDGTLGPSKGKEKIASSGPITKVGSWLASSNTEMTSENTVPLERRRSWVHSDGSSVDGLQLPGR
jgi:hypothetical protein